jgi:hypothetical protein
MEFYIYTQKSSREAFPKTIVFTLWRAIIGYTNLLSRLTTNDLPHGEFLGTILLSLRP